MTIDNVKNNQSHILSFLKENDTRNYVVRDNRYLIIIMVN